MREKTNLIGKLREGVELFSQQSFFFVVVVDDGFQFC